MKSETKYIVKSQEITNCYAGSWQNGLEFTLNNGEIIISIEMDKVQMEQVRDGLNRRIEYLEKQKLEQAQELLKEKEAEA